MESWGRGTLKMIELTRQAGLVAPEFVIGAGEVIVRFRPTDYSPPTRIGHDLNALQRDILAIVAQAESRLLHEILALLPSDAPRRTVQNNLQFLKSLRLVRTVGKGGGARWLLSTGDD